MNRAARRRAERQARKGSPASASACPWCASTAGYLVEICTEGCCAPKQSCSSCGVPVGA